MEKLKDFLHRKDIEISVKRYGIDALGAGAGTVLFPFDRNHYQYTGKSASYSVSDYDSSNSQ